LSVDLSILGLFNALPFAQKTMKSVRIVGVPSDIGSLNDVGWFLKQRLQTVTLMHLTNCPTYAPNKSATPKKKKKFEELPIFCYVVSLLLATIAVNIAGQSKMPGSEVLHGVIHRPQCADANSRETRNIPI
jgi:hypothetical protein